VDGRLSGFSGTDPDGVDFYLLEVTRPEADIRNAASLDELARVDKAIGPIAAVHTRFRGGTEQTVGCSFRDQRLVYRFVRDRPVAPETLAPFLTWDRQHYTRNLIDKTENYALMAICWEKGQNSSIHNHQDQNCWMAVLMGWLLVQNYLVVLLNIDEGKCALENRNIRRPVGGWRP
jgi:hypothetical protein